MLPSTVLQIISLSADLLLFVFLVYYAVHLNKKEKELHAKETKVDQDYHHVVNEALDKERQIITDATSEADKILLDTELLSKSSTSSIDHTLEALVEKLQKDSTATSQTYHDTYQQALKHISQQSLQDFQNISKDMQETLKKQIAMFHQSLLPAMEKELASYKQARMQETEQEVKNIVHAVSQELLNKTIPREDHEKLLIEALERAKQKGIFA